MRVALRFVPLAVATVLFLSLPAQASYSWYLKYQCSYCYGTYEPVCGENGKDYDNECFADCAGTSVACSTTCPCDEYEEYEYENPTVDFCVETGNACKPDESCCGCSFFALEPCTDGICTCSDSNPPSEEKLPPKEDPVDNGIGSKKDKFNGSPNNLKSGGRYYNGRYSYKLYKYGGSSSPGYKYSGSSNSGYKYGGRSKSGYKYIGRSNRVYNSGSRSYGRFNRGGRTYSKWGYSNRWGRR